MSRKYMNDRWCVRCGKKTATPYLAKNFDLLSKGKEKHSLVVDIGCGNGRNTEFCKAMGYKNTIACDMAGDFDAKVMLGHDKLPTENNSADIILANYILMFLDKNELDFTIDEIKRIAKSGTRIIFESYGAKDSFYPSDEKSAELTNYVFEKLGWKKIRKAKERFIAECV